MCINIIKLPINDVDKFVECVGNAIADNTRLAVFDSITSPTGAVLPIQKLIDVCHSKGVPVLIDGAHAPGQVSQKLLYIYIYIIYTL